MSELDFTGIALVIAAFGTLVTAIGIAIVGIMAARQGKVIQQVEKQSNSAALELKRVTAAALRAAAAATKLPEDERRARDAEILYEEAKKQAEANEDAKP